jgi:hypothetical protein
MFVDQKLPCDTFFVNFMSYTEVGSTAIMSFFIIFFLVFIPFQGPGRAHHASITAETSVQSVLPNNTLKLTWAYTNLHRAA